MGLSLLARIGGHVQPRTHCDEERFPGMHITYAMLEKVAEKASQALNVLPAMLLRGFLPEVSTYSASNQRG